MLVVRTAGRAGFRNPLALCYMHARTISACCHEPEPRPMQRAGRQTAQQAVGVAARPACASADVCAGTHAAAEVVAQHVGVRVVGGGVGLAVNDACSVSARTPGRHTWQPPTCGRGRDTHTAPA
jgi:hypothetical protein